MQYFLGANSPEGFYSLYAQLFSDTRLQRVILLKGGPGCGKSTLMKAVCAEAQAHFLQTEQVLCSSDPASLDGILIPALGVAIADATAPHILEPPLCGCGAEYLDMGQYYDRAALKKQHARLAACKQANAACYRLAYRCLRAVAAVQENLHALAEDADTSEAEQALHALLPAHGGTPEIRRCFFHALTPRGCLTCTDALQPDQAVCVLEDNFGVGSAILQRIFLRCGAQPVITGCNPLAPETLSALLLPERRTAFVRADAMFSYDGQALCRFDLDACILHSLSEQDAAHAGSLLQIRTALVQEAVSYLRQAKALHDELEALYRPCVDFSAVSRLTEALCLELFAA